MKYIGKVLFGSPRRLLTFALLVTMLFAALGALADIVTNNIDTTVDPALETVTIVAGGSGASVGYVINVQGAGADGEGGCNATVASPATVSIITPAGVNAAPSSVVFTGCNSVQSITFTSSAAGSYTINVSVSDSGPGTYNTAPASFTLVVNPPPDSTPPTITPVVSGTLGNNGWYTGNVNVSWTVTDSESAISSSTGCGTSTVSSDTTGTTFTCSATSGGGTSSNSVTIKRDATAPSASASRTPLANANGWNNTDVTVSFSGTDATSGIAGCIAAVTLSGEGAGQSASGTCTDNAGNVSASASVTNINIDKSKPVISGSRTPAANANGWNNGNVTVSFTCADGLSGVDGNTVAGAVVSAEGVGQSVTNSGTCTDKAGNTADSVTVSGINIDKTAPNSSASPSPAANANGWNNSAVTVTFSGTDGGSGIDFCDTPTVLSAEGAGQSATGSCTDKAGNSASATASNINIDLTAPSVSASPDPAANANGWNNTDVTVSYTCTDADSSVDATASSLGDDVLSASGTASGTCVDNAGNSASASYSAQIDKIAPSVSASPDPAANANGWNNSAVTVSFSGTDGGSGIDFCGAATVLSNEGAAQSATGSCTDKAGNSASATASDINIDLTAPDTTIDSTPANPTNSDSASFTFSGSDAGSGVASFECQLDAGGFAPCASQANYSSLSDGSYTFDVRAVDAADNADATPASFTWFVDTAIPNIVCDSPDGVWHANDVTLECTATDDGSGVAGSHTVSLSTSVPAGTENANASTNSQEFCDNAGNCATAGPIAGNMVDKKAPSVTCAAADSVWHNANVSVNCTATDGGSGPASQSVTLSTSIASGAESSNAFTNSQSVVDAAGNSANAGPVGPFKIDRKGPSVVCIGTPTFTKNQAGATVSATVTDGGSGAAASPVTAPASTTTVGTFSVSVTGADTVGNSTTVNCSYKVVYNWSGFFQPVDNLPTVNSVKAGSAVPVKFSLGGNQGLNIFAAGYPKAALGSCAVSSSEDAIEETSTAGSSSLTYDPTSNQYIYVWKTEKSWAGKCGTLTVIFIDGTTKTASFKFK